MKAFRDVDPETFAELQKFISEGEQLIGPYDQPLQASERQSLLAASADLCVTGRCGCGDAECKTYNFVATTDQGRPIQFNAGPGLAIVFVRSDSEILSFERLLHTSRLQESDDDWE